MKLAYETTDEVRRLINKIGRTEDVTFSPDSRRFILVDFITHKLHLFNVDFDRKVNPPGITITNYSRIISADIVNPHGVCFLGNDKIVVCNRYGGVSIFNVPDPVDEINEFDIKAEAVISGRGFLNAKVKTPGSVDCLQLSENRYRIFVCNNHWHMINSHVINLGDPISVINEGVLIENSLKIPDGICVSPDGKWISISNHVYGQAVLYENTSSLNRKTSPSVVFDDPVCPHGTRFSPDGKKLYVADASSQYLYIYENEEGDWKNAQTRIKTVRILDDETFYNGRYGAKEGGLKGIAIDRPNSVLITTHQNEVIGFYDLNVIKGLNHKPDKNETAELRRQRDETFTDDNRLNKRWTLYYRTREIFTNNKYLKPANYKLKLVNDLKVRRLKSMNRTSGKSLIDPSGPVISLTSHGERIEKVFYTIESIRQGSKKPSRIILWLDDEDKHIKIPQPLQRLKEAGLEIYYSENIGPHKKYFSFIQQNDDFIKPLVTADDDIIYPSYWLKKLVEAYESDPSVIHCYRAHRIELYNGKFTPYNDWKSCKSDTPSHANFLTGVSGVIYPPSFLKFLKQMGDGFLSTCPKADDVWLNIAALRAGFKVAQLGIEPRFFAIIPGSQTESLYHSNVDEGGSHHQLVETFMEEDIRKLEAFLIEEMKSNHREVSH